MLKNVQGKDKRIIHTYWNSELNIADVNSIRNSKLRTLKMFESKFAMEGYLINLHDFESRRIASKFRCSDHTLVIETGHHKKIDVEERMCRMCSQKRVKMSVISS